MSEWDDGNRLKVPAGTGGGVDSVDGQTGVVTLSASYQPLAAVLTGTTASFTTADETKLDAVPTITVSALAPSGGNNGDLWFQT